MTDQVARFVQKFEVDDRQARQQLGAYERAAKLTTGSVSKLSGAVKGLLATAAAGLSIAGLRALTTDSIQAVQRFRALSLAMGGTIEQAAVMSDVFQSAGVDIEAANEALSKWGMAQAQFKRLKPGEMLGGETRAWQPLLGGDFASAFVKIGREVKGARTETDKLAIATGYFGEAGRKFLPVLLESEATLRKIATGEGAGGFSAEGARVLEQSRRDLAAIDQEWAQIKVTVAREVAPPLIRMAKDYMPGIRRGAEVVARAMGGIAEHADDVAQALVVASSAWAAMKASNMVANFAMAARYATQIAAASKTAAGAAGVGAGASILAGMGITKALPAAKVLGPSSFTAATVGATAATGGGIGARLLGLLGGAGRFAVRGLPGLGLLGLGYSVYSAYSDEAEANQASNLPPNLRRAFGRGGGGPLSGAAVEIRAAAVEAQRLTEEYRRQQQQVQDTTETLSRFERQTGISGDRLRQLGFDLEAFGGAVRKGGAAADRAWRQAAARDALDKAGIAGAQAGQMERALLALGPVAAVAKREGMTIPEVAASRLNMVREAIAGMEKGQSGGAYLRRLGLGPDATIQDLQQLGQGLKLGGALAQAVQAEKRLSDLQALLDQVANGAAPTYNIGTVNINQDLRGEDPDRVLLHVTEGLARLSEHRTQGRTGPHPMVRRR